MTFEEKLVRLEALADQLRDGSAPPDQAARLFEEGIKLSKVLDKELQSYERRVEILSKEPDADGRGAELQLFPELGAPDDS